MSTNKTGSLIFHYDAAPQRSPEWLALKRGKIGSSSLWRWLAVSKAKATVGKPLKERLDYEKELMFERQFNTNFEKYFNSAMQDGIDYEDFGRKQYEQLKGEELLEVGCWYNDFFVASPDRKIVDKNAGIEIKILKDNSFLEVIVDGVIDKHWKQIQGQLWGTGWDYIDYVAVNFNTGKVVIIRVLPDKEFMDYLAEAVQEELVQEEFSITNIHDIVGEIPDGFSLESEKINSASRADWAE